MSEEEIIKNINEMIELIDDECYISISEDIESIKGLLELYNKEKDYNANLSKEIKLMKSVNINENFISKDKIRELIEELDSISEHAYKNSNVGLGVGLNYAISKLKELVGDYDD